MATVATDLANSIDASDVRARLDAVAKRLIKHRIILAEILKECVDEFKELDIKFIEENCFVGEVQVNEVAVDQDMLDADSTIIGSNTEDKSDSEGAVYYDLVFDALVPSTQKLIRLVINIEIQVETKLSYAIVTRGVYYTARLISRQKGSVFTDNHYEKIQKVYSIWICPDPKKGNRNSIAEYGFTQQKVVGSVNEPAESYDKMKVIVISLNDDGMDNRNDIIRLLSALLSTSETVEKRKQILEDEFNIPMTKEIEEEVLEMCNLGQAVEMKGAEKAMLENIEKMIKNLKLTAQQAMDALEIPKSDQARYAKKLDTNS